MKKDYKKQLVEDIKVFLKKKNKHVTIWKMMKNKRLSIIEKIL